MPEASPMTSQVHIKVNGQDAQPDVISQLNLMVVDQHAHLPAMFLLKFADSSLQLLDDGPFNLTGQVEIAAEDEGGNKVTLIKGEITALEPHFGEGMIAELVVRGYDKSHRLYRETKSETYLNMKDSDIASKIAREGGLQSQVDTTNTVYEHIFQNNISPLAFLQQRAWRIGFECFVADDKLYFRKPSTSNAQPTLTWGGNLQTFRPRITLAEQVDEVLVKGWDFRKQAAIVGNASNGRLYPKIQENKKGASWASSFGRGRLTIVDQPVISQAEANALAAARLDEISGAYIEAEGVALRKPDIKAGQMVKLEGLGSRLSGDYLVTSATHTYTPAGLQTTFNVRGARTGLLTEQMGGQPTPERLPGVVVGVVTNTEDPDKFGRVKVKFPWLADQCESAWARVMGPGAGPESGLFMIPPVGAEVLVAFLHGDFNNPYVLGGVWNGKAAIPPESGGAGNGEKPTVFEWRSGKGHRIVTYDNADNKIDIQTAGGHMITLDDQNKKIIITSKGGHTLTLDDSGNKIIVESKNELEIKSTGNMKINAGANLEMQASGQVTIKGAVINLN